MTDTNGSQRRLTYDGHDLVLEYSGTGTLLRRFSRDFGCLPAASLSDGAYNC